MSANLDLVRSIVAAWERGDYSSTEWAHPKIEYVVADGPAPSIRTGVADMTGAARELLSTWEDFRAQVDDYREVDDERVLVLHHYGGRGRKSGLDLGQMQTRAAHVFHVRGGKVTKLVFYWDRERALADLP